jgi:acetate kinase
MKHSDDSTVVVTVNSGSTSIKLAAFRTGPAEATESLAREQQSGSGLDAAAVLQGFVSRLGTEPDVIAHRVVHGGTRFPAPVTIDSSVLQAIDELSELAPLHNPKALQWIAAARDSVPQRVMQVAVFDTSFFSRLPRLAAEYALPRKYGTDEGVRRYGFHGIAHESLWHRFVELNPQLPAGGRLITLQLGGGCSAAAIHHGQPLDTTMGFSPLEGLMMGTRSGDVDPAAVPYLQRRLAMTSDEIIGLLNHEAGISGMSGGVTDLGKLAADPDPDSQFIVDLFCYRVRKTIGALLCVLGGCDGVVFGGGIGEHVPAVRARILAGLSWAGIGLEPAANEAATGQAACISKPGAPVAVHVIPTAEEAILVRAARNLHAKTL